MSRTDAEPPEGPPAASEGRRSRAARLAATRDGGAGGAGPAPPQFSQPVRQIVLMLIVLVLVVAGAWFAYGRIVSIFHSNEYLNGLILAVFVMGVLGCFWQVAELVKSVSWIERFAARRRAAAERGVSAAEPAGPDDAPRLLAPLAALLGQRGPVGGAISTESSRSILESVATRIDEARDITRYLANLLIFLGLLGTFYGLATTVPAVVDTIRALAPQEGESGLEVFNKLMTGLESQLGGMATAFSSSLLGLAGSLVVGLLELFVAHGQNRFYRELEEWMSGFTRIGLGGAEGQGLGEAALAGFIERVEAQMAGLQAFYASRDELRDQEAAAADQRSLALAEGVERLAALLGTDRDRLGETLAAEREATAQALSGVERAIGGLAEPRRDPDLVALLERLAEGQDRLAAEPRHDPALPAMLERLAEGQERLAALASGSSPEDARLARALERLAEGQERLLELGAQKPAAASGDDPEARMRLRSIDVQLGRLVEESASGRDGLIAELRSDLAALTRAIRNLERGDGA
ncbi:hypothetical protein BDE18_1416 [Paracoccus pantotrophus]|uniref:Biopolymer transporter ExbB n=1 Tax=Paracoccus pantotrophus TaxID=82367 RepID=A0A1I5I2J8_PARPN|nr:hypothetical protein [Paracoccus pantotrophus]MDF3854891.1 hypothetical protein [Paracoccus pantotrophus]QFG37442.1 hypothetical protein ESD82_14970 [Paracoccus pantotrophus]QLH15091.1 hypothetical protein HYQ43_12670 [Paracoccus pantotrophus]RDD96597.1 hypothetical protein DTW92_11865 [Paracoccus pantotrophus]RKS52114.1 hypothetical protein BDE18_1416 [Paracoccus pantotrophus]